MTSFEVNRLIHVHSRFIAYVLKKLTDCDAGFSAQNNRVIDRAPTKPPPVKAVI